MKSTRLEREIFEQYGGWRDHGTCPGRAVVGRGALNPRLLEAFRRLSAEEANYREGLDAARNQPPAPTPVPPAAPPRSR